MKNLIPSIALALAVGLGSILDPVGATAAATNPPALLTSSSVVLPSATSSTRVTKKVKTWFCDASAPKRITTVTVKGRSITAKASGRTFVGKRKTGAKTVYLDQRPSVGFKNFWVKFASSKSKKAVKASFVC